MTLSNTLLLFNNHFWPITKSYQSNLEVFYFYIQNWSSCCALNSSRMIYCEARTSKKGCNYFWAASIWEKAIHPCLVINGIFSDVTFGLWLFFKIIISGQNFLFEASIVRTVKIRILKFKIFLVRIFPLPLCLNYVPKSYFMFSHFNMNV